MAIKYISDLHWYDINSLYWRDSLGLSLSGYVEMCVEVWNDSCSEEDIILLVGDIGIDKPCTISALCSLKGTKVLVLGNHDLDWSKDSLRKCFKATTSALTLGNVLVQHEPITGWDSNAYLVHGHHHSYIAKGMEKARLDYLHDRTRLNCCADLNNHKPCTLLELQINKENVRNVGSSLLTERI